VCAAILQHLEKGLSVKVCVWGRAGGGGWCEALTPVPLADRHSEDGLTREQWGPLTKTTPPRHVAPCHRGNPPWDRGVGRQLERGGTSQKNEVHFFPLQRPGSILHHCGLFLVSESCVCVCVCVWVCVCGWVLWVFSLCRPCAMKIHLIDLLGLPLISLRPLKKQGAEVREGQ